MNKYITDMLVEKTSYKSIKNAYQRNNLSIVCTMVMYGILTNAPPTNFMTE